MATGSDDIEAATCSVCLDPYRDPKFLPCHHTFCAQCITHLARSSGRKTFPCPSCRKPTSLPKGGVAALQTNFYIKIQAAGAGVPLKRKVCPIHDDKTLEFYCVKCDRAICINCKLTEHEQHKAQDLNKAAREKKVKLAEEVPRLQEAVDSVQKQVEGTREEQQAALDKKVALERNIRDRHAIMVAAADKLRDEALESLRSVGEDVDREIAGRLERQEANHRELLAVQQRLDQTLREGTFADIVTVARQMKSGPGSKQAVRRLVTKEASTTCRPVLLFKDAGDPVLEKGQDFMGKASKMDLDLDSDAIKVRVEKRFNCGLHAGDVKVFSLCPVDTNPREVWVSFERRGLDSDVPELCFGEHGGVQTTGTRHGRVSYKSHENEALCRSPAWEELNMCTFSKSSTEVHYRLDNDSLGKATVYTITVTSTVPFKTTSEEEFKITVGPHRAFDVDEDEDFFAVVEEAESLEEFRKVKLYQRTRKAPVTSYDPPTEECQPSDVCFYKLGEKQVLLVTDEVNDAIHIVDMEEDGELTFRGYLAPGHPLLIQPTAINVDGSNTLWIACRGGDVITIKPTVQERGAEEEEDEDEDEEDED